MTHDETEWTEDERKALDALPREVDPGRLLEERTVAALKERGLLHGTESDVEVAGPRLGPGSRLQPSATPGSGLAGRFHPAWWAAGIAAALALFFGGMALGQNRAGLTTEQLATALRSADAAERSSLIQQTGSLYVDAIAGLAMNVRDGETVGTGVEVGLTALYAAAYELARLHPEDARLRAVLQALESHPTNGDPETDVHWF